MLIDNLFFGTNTKMILDTLLMYYIYVYYIIYTSSMHQSLVLS